MGLTDSSATSEYPLAFWLCTGDVLQLGPGTIAQGNPVLLCVNTISTITEFKQSLITESKADVS